MNLKSLTIAAFALSLVGGVAFAQDTNSTTADEPGDVEAQVFGDENFMRVGPGFFTDDTMSALRTEDEIRTTFSTLSAEDQEILRSHCASNTDNPRDYPEAFGQLCQSMDAM